MQNRFAGLDSSDQSGSAPQGYDGRGSGGRWLRRSEDARWKYFNPRRCSDSGEEELTLGATQGEAPASRREAQTEEELEGRRLHNRFESHHTC